MANSIGKFTLLPATEAEEDVVDVVISGTLRGGVDFMTLNIEYNCMSV